jgi:hypothetical protein
MKFLTKNKDSEILAKAIVYKKNGDNTRLRDMLLAEQCGFCAYTEKRVNRLDSVEVEHFNRTKKGADDYFNYYAVIRNANQRKIGKEKKHAGAAFFNSLFFQDKKAFDARIRYVIGDSVYEETSSDDREASDLIDYLGFNDSCLHEERARHIRMLKDLFLTHAEFSSKEIAS